MSKHTLPRQAIIKSSVIQIPHQKFYTEKDSKIGFWRRWLVNDFESASIAQLIQVELLRQRHHLIQTHDASLSNFRFLNHFRYMQDNIHILNFSCAIKISVDKNICLKKYTFISMNPLWNLFLLGLLPLLILIIH